MKYGRYDGGRALAGGERPLPLPDSRSRSHMQKSSRVKMNLILNVGQPSSAVIPRTLLLGFFWLAASSSVFAQKFEADLSETLEWLAPAGLVEAQVPADAPERATYPMPAEQPGVILDQLPGKPFHKMDPPPQSAAWWKYPIYGVIGFPRDLIDSFFGLFSYVPLINVPLVGVIYEIVPTQAIMRDPRDWHRWPGTTNAKGHGFFPAEWRVRDPQEWKDKTTAPPKLQGDYAFNETWGFFPTAHSMKFTYASQSKIRRLLDENDQTRRELQEMNREIDIKNRQITERQKQARDAAIKAIDAGDGKEATSRMLPYHAAYPADEVAFALLMNSLAVYADSGPSWVRPFLFQNLADANQGRLQQSDVLIRKSAHDFPKSVGPVEALVYIQTRLLRPKDALATAEAGFNVDPKDPRRARLLFEAALMARDESKANDALAAIDRTGTPADELDLMALRLDLLAGRAANAQPQLGDLAAAKPDNAAYHYYLGVADLSVVDKVDVPEQFIKAAFDELEKAALTAPTRPLRERASRALNYARGLAAAEGGKRPAKTKPKGLFEVTR